jgi:predicted transglutaminase-like cysteine proteinase
MSPLSFRFVGLACAAIVLGSGPVQARDHASAFLQQGEVADAPFGFVEMCQRDMTLCVTGLPSAERLAQNNARPAPRGKYALAAAGQSMAGQSITGQSTGGQVATSFSTGVLDVIVAATVEGLYEPKTADQGEAAFRVANAAAAGEPGRMHKWHQLLDGVNRKVNQETVQMPDFVTTGHEEYWDLPRSWHSYRKTGDCEDLALEKRAELIAAGFPVDRLALAVVYRRGMGLHAVLVAHLDDGDYVLDSATNRVALWSQTSYVWLRLQSRQNPMEWHVPQPV